MVNCDEMRLLIGAVVDREASPEQQKQVMEHIRECDACREVYDMLTGVDAALAPEAEVPVDFTARVMDAVRQEPIPSRQKKNAPWMRRLKVYGAIAACIALIVWGGVKLSTLRMGSSDKSASMSAGSAAPAAQEYAAESAAVDTSVTTDAVPAESPAAVSDAEKKADTNTATEETVDAAETPQAEEGTDEAAADDGWIGMLEDWIRDDPELDGYRFYVFLDGYLPEQMAEASFTEGDAVSWTAITTELLEELRDGGWPVLERSGEGAVAIVKT